MGIPAPSQHPRRSPAITPAAISVRELEQVRRLVTREMVAAFGEFLPAPTIVTAVARASHDVNDAVDTVAYHRRLDSLATRRVFAILAEARSRASLPIPPKAVGIMLRRGPR